VAGGLLPTLVAPWLHYLPTCASTNTWAIANLFQLNHGDVVFTRQQTAGRGQHGRAWHSEVGVLTASLILANISVDRLPGLSLVVGVAIAEVLGEFLPDLAAILQIKWANDLVLKGKKLGGILCEAKCQMQNCKVVVGIGLNLTAKIDPQILPHAISLNQVTDQSIPSDLELLASIRESLLIVPILAAKLTDFRCRDFLLGKLIQVQLGKEILVGQAMGISDRGELQLATIGGEVRSLRSGHILT
jgi:BirA family transcriptional regulator, biotin operon repressor / biotin---[acetyl-CoA-carboxylase] ligase